LADPAASADLIAFLQALPEGRKRRGVRYPQWLLLLMAILGSLSGCRSARAGLIQSLSQSPLPKVSARGVLEGIASISCLNSLLPQLILI